jgi:hypothetical protein
MGGAMKESAELRRRFLAALLKELRVVWPIVSGLIGAQLALGMLVGFFEGWRMSDAAYFTFVTGLTIGYGDLVPVRFTTRLITVVIGFSGILLTGLVAAVGVRALQEATTRDAEWRPILPRAAIVITIQANGYDGAGTPCLIVLKKV